MNFSAIAAMLIASFVVSTIAAPTNFYQQYQQPSFYYQSRSSPQHLMYMQYVQQPSLSNAAAAFVAGDTVATGTYVKDDSIGQQTIAAETVLDNTGANGAQSVAEAYPDPQEEDVLDYDAPLDAEPQVPEVPELPEDNQTLGGESAPAVLDPSPESVVADAVAHGAPESPEPLAAAVELEEEAINDDEEEGDEDDYVPNVRRQVSPKATPAASQPTGSFFSVDFGGANGGAVAISNSYSTGSKGSSKSQAVAFGDPDEYRQRSLPSRRRH